MTGKDPYTPTWAWKSGRRKVVAARLSPENARSAGTSAFAALARHWGLPEWLPIAGTASGDRLLAVALRAASPACRDRAPMEDPARWPYRVARRGVRQVEHDAGGVRRDPPGARGARHHLGWSRYSVAAFRLPADLSFGGWRQRSCPFRGTSAPRAAAVAFPSTRREVAGLASRRPKMSAQASQSRGRRPLSSLANSSPGVPGSA